MKLSFSSQPLPLTPPQFHFPLQNPPATSEIYSKNGATRQLNKSNKRRKIGQGKWKMREREAYLRFLWENWELFENERMRRSTKVFILMAQKVGSRTADQCRSHHQKMILYNHSLEGVLASFTEPSRRPLRRPFHRTDQSITSKRSSPLPTPIQVQLQIMNCLVRITIDISSMQSF